VRFGEDEVVNLTLKVVAYGGAVTWDVPVERGGTISRSFMGRLRQLGRVMATMGGTFVANPAPVPAAAPSRGR
jgi:hypothetical protein